MNTRILILGLTSFSVACGGAAEIAKEPATQPGATETAKPVPQSSATAASAPSSPHSDSKVETKVDKPVADAPFYDASNSRKDPKIETKVDKAEQAKVLKKLFPKYLNDVRQCASTVKDLADARSRGQVVPNVISAVSGSFTAAGTSQRLYLVSVGECGATHADSWGTSKLVVLQGESVVAKADLPGGSALGGVFDLDADGRAEVLVTSGFMNQGGIVQSASLVRTGGENTLTTVKDFGTVLDANCGPAGTQTQEYSVIRVVAKPGAQPEFHVEKKTSGCE